MAVKKLRLPDPGNRDFLSYMNDVKRDLEEYADNVVTGPINLEPYVLKSIVSTQIKREYDIDSLTIEDLRSFVLTVLTDLGEAGLLNVEIDGE